MSEDDKPKLFFKFIILGLFTYLLISQPSGNSYTSEASPQAPTIAAAIQPGAPIGISSITLNSSDPLEPNFSYLISNTSQKPIDAYAIRYVVAIGNTSSEVIELRLGGLPDTVMPPGHAEWGAYEGHTSSQPVRGIKLIVDFVRFTDGTVWGGDKHKSSEQVSGHRVGIQAEANRLLEIKKSNGLEAVLDSIATVDESISPPPGHSPQWIEGFRGGVAALHGRLKRVHKQGGAASVEEELRRILNSSERSAK